MDSCPQYQGLIFFNYCMFAIAYLPKAKRKVINPACIIIGYGKVEKQRQLRLSALDCEKC